MKRCETLGQLFPEQALTADAANTVFNHLKIDSRFIDRGDIFICLRGLSYLAQAEAAGAVAVVVDTQEHTKALGLLAQSAQNKALPVIAIDNLETQLAIIAERCYQIDCYQIDCYQVDCSQIDSYQINRHERDHSAARPLEIAGVTGTNGKSTVAVLLAQLLHDERLQADHHESKKNASARSVGVIGTLGAAIIGKTPESTGMTTPDIFTNYRLASDFSACGVDVIAMEVSSHGLSQGRVDGLPIKTAIFTNLTQDHLDYHESFEAYAAAKQKLFRLPSVTTAIVNVDDEFHRTMLENTVAQTVYTVGLQNPADISARNVTALPNGMSFDLYTPWGQARVDSPLLGVFNIYNVLAAFSGAIVHGADFKRLVKSVAQLQPVPGRMQLLPMVDGIQTIVDFAHTPDGLEQALLAVKSHTVGRIWCVFGCGGDRDMQKRALMGAIADETADEVIITSDNPRSENPDAITKAVASGCKTTPRILSDRKQAIRFAIEHASTGDTILIAGKGHEAFQIIADKKIPFSDVAVATEILIERQQKLDGRQS